MTGVHDDELERYAAKVDAERARGGLPLARTTVPVYCDCLVCRMLVSNGGFPLPTAADREASNSPSREGAQVTDTQAIVRETSFAKLEKLVSEAKARTWRDLAAKPAPPTMPNHRAEGGIVKDTANIIIGNGDPEHLVSAPPDTRPYRLTAAADYHRAYHRAVEQANAKHAAGVTGLSPDAPVTTNAQGGKQSHTDYDFTLLDPAALFRLAEVMKYGADKYGPDNWRLITVKESINHLIGHCYAFLAGDTSDDHLGHIFARAHMALAAALQPPPHISQAEYDAARVRLCQGAAWPRSLPAEAAEVCQHASLMPDAAPKAGKDTPIPSISPFHITLSADYEAALADEDVRGHFASRLGGGIAERLRAHGAAQPV